MKCEGDILRFSIREAAHIIDVRRSMTVPETELDFDAFTHMVAMAIREARSNNAQIVTVPNEPPSREFLAHRMLRQQIPQSPFSRDFPPTTS